MSAWGWNSLSFWVDPAAMPKKCLSMTTEETKTAKMMHDATPHTMQHTMTDEIQPHRLHKENVSGSSTHE